MRRVLLLVPPADGAVIRDYYCSKRSQAAYLHPPIDLSFQGGWFRARGLEPLLVDATVDRLPPAAALAAVRAARPDAIFALAGAVSWPGDEAFLEQAARATGAPLFASGDLFMDDPAAWLESRPWLSGVLTDFTSGELAAQLSGAPVAERRHLVLPGDARGPIRRTRGRLELPPPAHDLFVGRDYRYPFARRRPIAGTLVSYGCPYTCSFCITGELGTALRPAQDVLAELRALAALGVREVFFQDQCFGCAPRAPWDGLLEAMAGAGLGLGWWTFTRVDVLDRGLARRLRAAGCHTLILGVESASEEILREHRKGYGRERIREAFALCREEGLRTAATFILGLPEETEASLRATLDFACSLPADFASFNVAVPRAGTRLRERAVREGLVEPGRVVMDQSGFEPTLPTRGLTPSQLRAWRRRAVARFYLRPSYLWRRLSSLRSAAELAVQAREAAGLLRNLAAR